MSKGRGFARKVTKDTLDKFAPLLGRADSQSDGKAPGATHEDLDDANEHTQEDKAMAEAEALFGGSPVKVTVPSRLPASKKKPAQVKEKAAAYTVSNSAKGRLLWIKQELSDTDAQIQTGNPTGDIRLVQHRFEVDGKRIKSATYFRFDVFGDLTWTKFKDSPESFEAWADFHIKIGGQEFGVHRMRITHKPSGEAGQGNYTTGIHWGDAVDRNIVNGVSGRKLYLFAPPEGEASPYFIEIV